jgi:hypothetical protein
MTQNIFLIYFKLSSTTSFTEGDHSSKELSRQLINNYLLRLHEASTWLPPCMCHFNTRTWLGGRPNSTTCFLTQRQQDSPITPGSPLWGNLTRILFILYLHNARQTCPGWDLNPRPPAPQARTLAKIYLYYSLTIRNIYMRPPQYYIFCCVKDWLVVT